MIKDHLEIKICQLSSHNYWKTVKFADGGRITVVTAKRYARDIEWYIITGEQKRRGGMYGAAIVALRLTNNISICVCVMYTVMYTVIFRISDLGFFGLIN